MTQHNNEWDSKSCWVCASLDPTYEDAIIRIEYDASLLDPKTAASRWVMVAIK